MLGRGGWVGYLVHNQHLGRAAMLKCSFSEMPLSGNLVTFSLGFRHFKILRLKNNIIIFWTLKFYPRKIYVPVRQSNPMDTFGKLLVFDANVKKKQEKNVQTECYSSSQLTQALLIVSPTWSVSLQKCPTSQQGNFSDLQIGLHGVVLAAANCDKESEEHEQREELHLSSTQGERTRYNEKRETHTKCGCRIAHF